MGRKERCPQCGSKKINFIERDLKRCKICNYEWKGKERGSYARKEKRRF